jgi:hypothetical protein
VEPPRLAVMDGGRGGRRPDAVLEGVVVLTTGRADRPVMNADRIAPLLVAPWQPPGRAVSRRRDGRPLRVDQGGRSRSRAGRPYLGVDPGLSRPGGQLDEDRSRPARRSLAEPLGPGH